MSIHQMFNIHTDYFPRYFQQCSVRVRVRSYCIGKNKIKQQQLIFE